MTGKLQKKSIWRIYIEEHLDDKKEYEDILSSVVTFVKTTEELNDDERKHILYEIKTCKPNKKDLLKYIYNSLLKFEGSEVLKYVKKRKKNEFYVNPDEFEQELMKFYDSGIISNKLSNMIVDMVNGLAHAGNFVNYSFRDEAIGDCYEGIMKALRNKKYKPGTLSNRDPGSKATAFSYFNAIGFNCWRNIIKKEKRRRDTLEAYKEEVYYDYMREYGYQGEEKQDTFYEE